MKENSEKLQLDNPEMRDMEDSTYYTKSKMMLDVTDMYDGDDE